ncbi:unnamed protein product [Euphydryas editha]|uniref:Uncharacterized protein n=1 Tax=Euphydryas editha TaxID=104508 RepID=A0AAU9UIW8_EUPED|nr:unnamed protein product [Euphydryas editha]
MAVLIFLSTFFLFAQGYDNAGQCRVEFMSQPPTLTTASYIHPTQFVIPAVVKPLVEPINQTPIIQCAPESNNFNYPSNPPSMPPIVIGRDDDDDFRSILYMLIFALGKKFGKESSSCGNGCCGCKGSNNFGGSWWLGGINGNDGGCSCGGGSGFGGGYGCGGCHNGGNFGFEPTYEITPTYEGEYNIVISPGFGGNTGCGGGYNNNENDGFGEKTRCGKGCNNNGNYGFGGNSGCGCNSCKNGYSSEQFKYDNSYSYDNGHCGCGCHNNIGLNELPSANGVTYIPYPIIIPTNCACSTGLHNYIPSSNSDNGNVQTNNGFDSNEINLRIITD